MRGDTWTLQHHRRALSPDHFCNTVQLGWSAPPDIWSGELARVRKAFGLEVWRKPCAQPCECPAGFREQRSLTDRLVCRESKEWKMHLLHSEDGNMMGHCNLWSIYSLICWLPALIGEGGEDGRIGLNSVSTMMWNCWGSWHIACENSPPCFLSPVCGTGICMVLPELTEACDL